jgi:hypothetical protein
LSTALLVFGIALPWLIVGLFIVLGSWIGFQLIHQNGRLLTRVEALEQRLTQMAGAPAVAPNLPLPPPQPAAAPASPPGLPVGSPAPDFELPDLAGARRRLTSNFPTWRGLAGRWRSFGAGRYC